MDNFQSYKEIFENFNNIEIKLGYFPTVIDGIITKIDLDNNTLTVDIALYKSDKKIRFQFIKANLTLVNMDTASPNPNANYVSNVAINNKDNILSFVITGYDFKSILGATFEKANVLLIDDTEKKERNFINSTYQNLVTYNKSNKK